MNTINTSKSKYIIFQIKKTAFNFNLSLYLDSYNFMHNRINVNTFNCNTIDKVYKWKYLGIFLDNRLK